MTRPRTEPSARATARPAASALATLALLAAVPATAHGAHHHSRSHAARRSSASLRAYLAAVRAWHDPSNVAPAAHTADGQLVLRMYSVNTRARAELTPAAGPERFDEAARAHFAEILADPRSHETHEIDPRLIDALYQVASHFNAPEVRVVSGYRAGDGHSNHAQGCAVDFIVAGTANTRVIEFARTLGDVGVGYYPVSGFVHLDVRDRPSYWVDVSGPGRPAHYVHRHHHRTARRDTSHD